MTWLQPVRWSDAPMNLFSKFNIGATTFFRTKSSAWGVYLDLFHTLDETHIYHLCHTTVLNLISPSKVEVVKRMDEDSTVCFTLVPQWEAADAEIKVPFVANTKLKGSLFKTWSRSVYCQTCYAYWHGFLPCLLLPFRSIHLHFFPKPLPIFSVLAVANAGSCVGPQNEIGHPAECRFQCWVPAE